MKLGYLLQQFFNPPPTLYVLTFKHGVLYNVPADTVEFAIATNRQHYVSMREQTDADKEAAR